MWADGQLEHRIELLALYALEHEANAQGDVRHNKAPINQVSNHVNRLHANQRLTDHGEDEHAVADGVYLVCLIGIIASETIDGFGQ
jgi:hypothetical protein